MFNMFAKDIGNRIVFIIIGLIALEKFIENDFECPCDKRFRTIIFILYLVTPATTAFTVTFFLASMPKTADSARGRRRQNTTTSSIYLSRFVFSFFSSFICTALFLSDGRYMACLHTELNGEYADSSPVPAWEWCDKKRILTDIQRNAHAWFYISKILGFSLMLILSVLALALKCCHPCLHSCCQHCCQDICSALCEDCCDECCKEFVPENEAHAPVSVEVTEM
ncbi:hypothetical protein P4O66_021024 [Electrophorus voltai]|uniref:Uncharacterized protein n=1 Tax=Electrophorus voltai TaxID=2609070 RepID=A0AAD8ZQI5_9TELE|nr:hypothetical protein P4O66_021024 [Electrophorus voltai]